MFKNLFYIQYPLYFPEDGVGGIADLPVDDVKDDNEETDTDTEEVGEEDKDEEEDKEDKEDDKDDDLALARVDYKTVKEKFPSLFKDFPELKHAFFREQQFSEIFPTVEEAQRALDAQNAYEEITASVIQGDANKFISELRAEDEKGFNKFAKNFIPALQEQNKDLYFDVIAPTVQQFVKNVYAHARTIDNEEERNNVKSAAKIVHKILFGGEYNDIEKADTGLLSRTEPDDKKDNDERNKHMQEKYSGLYRDVTNTCYSKLDEEIAKGLEDLKARPGLRNLVVKAVKDKVLEELEKDTAYMGRMQGLWKREQRNGFSGTLKNSLITTFLAKSKAIVPKIRTDVRKEVIGKETGGNNGKERTDSTRITGGRENRGGKKPMSVARMKEEKITTTKGIFDAD